MPPDYESQAYWKNRFESERSFEWLGDGSDTILPHIRAYLVSSGAEAQSTPSRPAALLNIGAGTSSLSQRIRELYQDIYGIGVDQREIVHLDFAQNLVARMQEKEGTPGKGMRWVCADALKWEDLKAALGYEEGAFDLVTDKSTSDAISCGEDISFSAASPNLHPVLNVHLAVPGDLCQKKIVLGPVELLALHLASLVRAGGLWIALTFSPRRFRFLASQERHDSTGLHMGDYWEVENEFTIDAPTGCTGPAHAPVVQHYLFLLRRKGQAMRPDILRVEAPILRREND